MTHHDVTRHDVMRSSAADELYFDGVLAPSEAYGRAPEGASTLTASRQWLKVHEMLSRAPPVPRAPPMSDLGSDVAVVTTSVAVPTDARPFPA
jgi:hypothetical protein